MGQGRGVAEQVGAEGGTSTAQSLDELIASFKKLVIGYKLTGEERKKKQSRRSYRKISPQIPRELSDNLRIRKM